MTNAHGTEQLPAAATEEAARPPEDTELQRLRRVGKRLFGVSHCIIGLRQEVIARMSAQPGYEAAFCDELSRLDTQVVLLDVRRNERALRHKYVSGPPFIRFFASHPIRDKEGTLLGSIGLIDPVPRASFPESEQALLADLAALVGRELELRALDASQIELRKKNKSLRRRSLVDPLLGTWNRGAIMRILNIEAARCQQAGLPLSLIVADLDHFKKINDSHGHPAGDAVLVKVAGLLRSCIRPQEALGRYGGEEFLVVLPGACNATAMQVAERMRQAVAAQPEAVGGAMLQLSISAGVACSELFPAAGTEELISRADMALYLAKDAGRNRVVSAVPETGANPATPDLS